MYSNELIKIKDYSVRGLMNSMRNKDIKELLWDETSFLNYDANCVERIWYIKNNIYEQVKCPVCGKPTKIKKNEIKCCSFKCTRNKINSKTGLTRSQEIEIKRKETNSKINSETGLTGYQMAGINQAKTKNEINFETGLTKAQEIAIKTKEMMGKVNPETGLTGYQVGAKKAAITMKKINPETGLSIYDISLEKSKILKRKNSFNNIKKLFLNQLKDYTLLSLKDDYIINNRIKYQHKCGEIRIKYGQEQIRCLRCYPYNKSIAENKILEFCRSLSNNVISGNRQIIKSLELDIYIPDYNLAIEYNGLFWHSSYSMDAEDKNRHLNKTKLCKNLGIQLLHIFENEWENPIKQEIWKSIIRNKLGKSSKIFARKCKIRKILFKEIKEFLENNHLQGQCNSSINIGLYYNNELVSLMTFGKSRFNKKIDWELLRFCNKIGYSVIGGASRLFKYFLKNYDGSIISYADMRRSDGGLYKKLGFELSHESKPNYFYWKPGQYYIESRLGYQKHKLNNKLEEFDSKLSETENMYLNGYRKIYDCGNQVWIYK